MNEWAQIVGQHFGQSEGARQFIKDVKGHIATYRSMREADKRHQDPKDTFGELEQIREKATQLGLILLKADRQTLSYIEQGALLAPDNQTESLDWSEVDRIPQQLLGMAKAIGLVLGDLADDPDIKRRGYHKHTARNMLVKSVCESYSARLNEFPSAGDPRFVQVLDALLDDLGLPRGNIHRVLSDAIPSAPDPH